MRYSFNKYLQISAFNNGCKKAYFILPLDLSAGIGFTFKTIDGFNDGNPLKVYYSTEYVPGKKVSKYTLVDITNKFVISSGTYF